MKIAVLIKQVPDTYSERLLDATTGFLDRGASDSVIDEINERALEVALQYRDSDKSTEIVTVGLGPVDAKAALRQTLAIGADSAIHITDPAFDASDAAATAAAIAGALRPHDFDLIIAGNESTDGRGGVVPAAIAEHLGLPLLSFLDSVEIAGQAVSGIRRTAGGTAAVHAALPAVISITELNPAARFPSFKGIIGAKKKPISELPAAADAAQRAHSVVLSVAGRPQRAAGTKIIDDGTAAGQLADFLSSARLI